MFFSEERVSQKGLDVNLGHLLTSSSSVWAVEVLMGG